MIYYVVLLITHDLLCVCAQAWGGDGDFFVKDACKSGDNLRLFESQHVPVVVGEWSLATVTTMHDITELPC